MSASEHPAARTMVLRVPGGLTAVHRGGSADSDIETIAQIGLRAQQL